MFRRYGIISAPLMVVVGFGVGMALTVAALWALTGEPPIQRAAAMGDRCKALAVQTPDGISYSVPGLYAAETAADLNAMGEYVNRCWGGGGDAKWTRLNAIQQRQIALDTARIADALEALAEVRGTGGM